LLKGHNADGKTFKVHIDGYNQLDLLKGEGPGARKEIFYITDDGDLSAIRYNKWKVMFLAQRAQGFSVWREPLTPLRMPYIIDIRADPFERVIDPGLSYEYDKWFTERFYLMIPAQVFVAKSIETFDEFPPRQKPGKFSVAESEI